MLRLVSVALGSVRTGVVLLVVALSVCVFAQLAAAHADLIRSDPGSGAVIFLPPADASRPAKTVLRTWLTESAEARFSFLEVRGPSGERVDVEGSLDLESDGTVVSVEIEPRAIGEHTVNYRLLSAVDGHINTGTYTFFVSEAVPGAGSSLAQLPDELVMRVPQATGASSITVTLVRDGEPVATGSGDFAPSGDLLSASVDLPESAPGEYEVRWEMATNGGPKFGSYSFTVGGS